MRKAAARKRPVRTVRSRRKVTRRRTVPRQSPRSPAVDLSGLAPGQHALSTYLAVANVMGSLEFLERVLGFSRGVTLADTDGQLRYAEVRHGDSVVMLVRRGDATSPSGGAAAMYAYVADVDRAVAKAREAGAGAGDIEDKPWGDRVGIVTDPDGYKWLLATFRKLAPFD